MNPYIINQSPWTFMPTTQGTGLQDQFNAQAMQQMNQLTAQAGQSSPVQNSMNPMALAEMLKKMGNQTQLTGTTQLSDAQKSEINALGSDYSNPKSDYNTGKNGWGNYGE